MIPARLFRQLVDRLDVLKEAGAGLGRREGGAVEINILVLAMDGPHSKHITFFRRDVDEGELPIEPADGGVGLADAFAGFDGEAERRGVGKPEAEDRVGYPWGAPVIHCNIHSGDAGKAELAGDPAFGEVGLAAIIEIADVVDGDEVAFHSRAGCFADFALPIGIGRRREGEPPDDGDDEKQRPNHPRLPVEFPPDHEADQNDRGDDRNHRTGTVVCQCSGCPEGGDGDGRGQQPE